MNIQRLQAASTVVYGFVEADDRLSHELWVVVDNQTIECVPSVVWVDGDDLDHAKEFFYVPEGTAPDWFIAYQSDGDPIEIALEDSQDIDDPSLTPLEAFIQRVLFNQRERLRVSGPPRVNHPLKRFHRPEVPKRLSFRAEDYLAGVLINPVPPSCFDNLYATGNCYWQEVSPDPDPSILRLWLNQPYIRIRRALKGTDVFDVFCLVEKPVNQGYWLKWQGTFRDMENALNAANEVESTEGGFHVH
ncbi:MAG: hypothetical protein FMJ08_06340 [Halomonas sp.]|nr:hypothetical protein [Halomonas sp.]TVM06292.1 MAG: hypothetical protein FMJ08_06340 [Halomonas sp.]